MNAPAAAQFSDSCLSADDTAFYESLKDYILSDDRMIENNYPVQHPEKRGCAALFNEKKPNPDRKWRFPTRWLLLFSCFTTRGQT